jgi:hypothetical protein
MARLTPGKREEEPRRALALRLLPLALNYSEENGVSERDLTS